MEEEGHQQEREGRVSPPPPSPAPSLLYAAFNQDSSFFVSGTERGFRVYRCQHLKEMLRQESDEGGLSVVQMVDRYNIFAVVGGGPNPHYPPNKVMIWDDHQVRCIGELSFRSDVKSVRLRRDQIVIVLLQKIYVYNFRDLKLLHQIETPANPKGLCEVSHSTGSMVLVCPGLQKGQVRVEHYALKRTKFFTAHDSRIACVAITQDGMFVATASSKGTLIRVFNSLDGSLLQEVRRGADKADIHSLAFAKTAQWLAASSGKGTVHVFSLKVDSGSYNTDGSRDSSEQNLSSSLSFLKGSYFAGMLPKYFNSEWSLAQFHLQEGCEYIVSFGHEKDTIVIIGMDGSSFYRCQFDPVAGGEMTQLEHHNFMKPEDAL